MYDNRWTIRQFLSSFFFLFGLLQFLFFVRDFFPQFVAAGGHSFQNVVCVGSAALLEVFYTLISIDRNAEEGAIRVRLLICGIPSVLICSVLSVYYGLPSLLLEVIGIIDRSAASAVWGTGFVISCAAFILVFLFLERRYRRAGEAYDAALIAYQQAYKRDTQGEER